jgi:hypothetical protein
MGMLIHEDGSERTVTPANKRAGFTLAELYAALRCRVIEVVWLQDGWILVVDQNGKLDRRPVNDRATNLARSVLQPHDVIVGPAILCSRQEFK